MRLTRTMTVFLVILLSFSCLIGKHTRIVKAEEKNPLKIEKIIGLSKEPGTFRKAQGLAVAKDGTIFIGDTGESQIEVYDANYKYLRTIGSLGTGEDQFQWIQSLHLDKEENLYVLDRFLRCIKVFSKEGKFLRKISDQIENDRYFYPSDFNFLHSGDIIILDSDFKIFSKDGKYKGKKDFVDNNNKILSYAKCITVDTEGNIFIGAWINQLGKFKFLKFNQSGKFLGEFLKWNRREEDDSYKPMRLSIAGDDLFFSDTYTVKKYKLIEKGTKPATYIETIAEKVKGKIIDKTSVIDVSGLVCANDKIYYLDSLINRTIVVSSKKVVLGTIESSIREMGFMYPSNEFPKNFLSQPNGITTGPDNLFYVTNRNLNKVIVFNSDWEEISSFGQPVLGKKKQLGELIYPNHIAVNQDGFIFVSDGNAFEKQECTIEIFDKEYKPYMSISIEPKSPGGYDFTSPEGLDFNSRGDLVVAIRSKNSVINIYDLSKLIEKKVSLKKQIDLDDCNYFLDDLVLDVEDNIILSTSVSGFLCWINSEGVVYQKIGSDIYGEETPVEWPSGLCLNGNNDLYVVDRSDSSIKKFSRNGELIWNSELNWLFFSYVTIDSQGKLYVPDMFHNVILVLSDSTALHPAPKAPTGNESNASFTFTVKKKK